NGNYWLGTAESGAVVFRPAASGRRYGRFFTLNTASGGNLLSDSVSCIEAWRTEAVYVGTNRGVGQIDIEGAVESYNEDAARLLGTHVRGSRVSDLAVDSLFVWVATDSGMSRYDRQPPYTVEFLPDSLRGAAALTVENFSGTIYAGTTKGVFKWNEPAHRWRKVANFSSTVCTLTDSFPALTIARLPDTRLYVGSERTVYFYNRFCWGELAPAGRPLVEDRRFETIVTTGDTAWSCQQNANGEGGYLEQCVIGRTPSQWIRFEVNGIPGNNVTQVALSRNGALWIGTQLAGVARLDASGRWCAF